jgi:hypothetical protein
LVCLLYLGVADGRYSTEGEKNYRKAVIPSDPKGKGKGKEKMYIHPPGDEEPSPMYEGLRTNLPHVSSPSRPLSTSEKKANE